MAEPTRIRLDHLLFPQPVAAGMNPFVMMGLVPMLRGSNEDPEPIEVRVVSEALGLYRIKDGRHRVTAAIMAGRSDVLAKIVED